MTGDIPANPTFNWRNIACGGTTKRIVTMEPGSNPSSVAAFYNQATFNPSDLASLNLAPLN